MNKNILIFFFLFLIDQEFYVFPLPQEEERQIYYLPMKKDHKFGDDICYYREIDEKLDYATYYVRPCEKGKYCHDEISSDQPFGYCRDILTNATDFPSYGEACSSNGECQTGLYCDGTCKKKCSNTNEPNPLQVNKNSITCVPDDYKKLDAKYCTWYEPTYNQGTPKHYLLNQDDITDGKFPGMPKECGIIRFTPINDYDRPGVTNSNGETTFKTYTRYFKQSEEWCSIGEAQDGDFVQDKYFCKSGFTLKFYPNGGLDDPSEDITTYTEQKYDMCVTPTAIDLSNPLVGCIITYKIGGGSEQKYAASKFGVSCNEYIILQSKLYGEFIEEFNNASEEDKINCYRIPQSIVGDCGNLKLLKLYYFYMRPEQYLFYKDRKKLETVLDYKIQTTYHRYYQSSTYLIHKYLFFILILLLI